MALIRLRCLRDSTHRRIALLLGRDCLNRSNSYHRLHVQLPERRFDHAGFHSCGVREPAVPGARDRDRLVLEVATSRPGKGQGDARQRLVASGPDPGGSTRCGRVVLAVRHDPRRRAVADLGDVGKRAHLCGAGRSRLLPRAPFRAHTPVAVGSLSLGPPQLSAVRSDHQRAVVRVRRVADDRLPDSIGGCRVRGRTGVARLRAGRGVSDVDPHRAGLEDAAMVRVRVQHAVAPSGPPRIRIEVSRFELRGNPHRVGPAVRHVPCRGRTSDVRADHADRIVAPARRAILRDPRPVARSAGRPIVGHPTSPALEPPRLAPPSGVSAATKAATGVGP